MRARVRDIEVPTILISGVFAVVSPASPVAHVRASSDRHLINGMRARPLGTRRRAENPGSQSKEAASRPAHRAASQITDRGSSTVRNSSGCSQVAGPLSAYSRDCRRRLRPAMCLALVSLGPFRCSMKFNFADLPGGKSDADRGAFPKLSGENVLYGGFALCRGRHPIARPE